MSFGGVLKDARNRKTLSLEEVHAKIKIHPHVLQLLEDEKFDKLPSPLFAKSFLKSYADFLEINPEETIKACEKIVIGQAPQSIYIRPAETKREGFDGQKILLVAPFLILAAIVIAAAAYYIPSWVGNLSKGTPKTQNRPSGLTQKQKTHAIQRRDTKREAPVKKELSVMKSADWLRSPEAGNFPVIKNSDEIQFELRAVDAVWVQITVDAKIVFSGILKKGSSRTWAAQQHVELWTGNAANMLWVVNKTSIGSPGKGMIRRMQLSRQGVRILPKEVS